jgi:NAD(P)-dependent dehydrogenase (short-subunit alcohol dehydrogenase family)
LAEVLFLSLRGKKIIVAGGSGLIGSAVVRALHERKAWIFNVDIVDGDMRFDMVQPEGIIKAIDFFGVPDVYVNAAYPRDFTIHALGAIGTSMIMLDRGCRNVINFSSIYGLKAPDFTMYPGTGVEPPSVEYAFLKSGIVGMTRWFAKRYAPSRVNAISPGGVFDNHRKEFVEQYERRTPLGKMADVKDVVNAVLFLASDASAYITGINLVVDGGWTL